MPNRTTFSLESARATVTRDPEVFAQQASSAFVPLRIERSGRGSFWAQLRSARAGGVTVSEVRAEPHRVVRRADARASAGGYKLSLLVSGRCLLAQDGREAVLGPGDLALYETSRPYVLELDRAFSMVVLMIPPGSAGFPAERADGLTAVSLGGERGVVDLARPFLTSLPEHLEEFCGAPGHRLACSTVELVAALIDERAGCDPDPRARLAERCKAYIEENLPCRDLGPATVAAAHHVSTRHLHALFHAQGLSVASWIRKRRLERCRRDLTDPMQIGSTVSAVAARWGFADIAHFSRAFRAEYGIAPSTLRAQALGPRGTRQSWQQPDSR